MAKANKKEAPAETAAEVDALLGSTKSKKAKSAKEAAAPAKKAKSAKEAPAKKAAKGKKEEPKRTRAESQADEIAAALLKVKKATSYADIAEKNDFDIRAVRRKARTMRDAGEIELVKEGTVVYVQPA